MGALQAGASVADVQSHTGHKGAAMVLAYARQEQGWDNHAARWLI